MLMQLMHYQQFFFLQNLKIVNRSFQGNTKIKMLQFFCSHQKMNDFLRQNKVGCCFFFNAWV